MYPLMNGERHWIAKNANSKSGLRGHAMATGPKGEKRPADVIGNAIKVARIATSEEQEEYEAKPSVSTMRATTGRQRSA